jgi:hypothetical protein
MGMKFAPSAALLTILLTGIAAQAATVDQIKGEVYDRQGSGGFRRVTTPIEVQTGDTVMASTQGSARLRYSNGCVIAVEPGQTIVVPETCGAAGHSSSTDYSVSQLGTMVGVGTVFGSVIYLAVKNDNPISP